MNIIEFNNVWEMYRIKFIRNKKVFWEEFWALEDISFKICKGETLGIVGENGAGKTTLLKLIAGMLVADRGEVNVKGKVSCLMELGAGFNPEFTGRENIILNSRVYGLEENEIEQKLESIIEFADIGKFIDAPVRCYSQGMYMRLAFALAIFVEPDILLIDDILAVGDEEAQQKCVKKIFELRELGKTIILVSHDTNMVEKLCDRALILEKGKIRYTGLPKEVVPRYLETVGDKIGISTLDGDKLRVVNNNGQININYDNSTITKGPGGCVSAFRQTLNNRMSSLNLRWKVLSTSLNEIIAEGYYMDGTVSQRWILKVYENELEWQIENKDAQIKELSVDVSLITGYERWITSNNEGDFGFFSHKVDWEEVATLSYYNNVVGLKHNFKKKILPFIGIETNRGKNRYLRLFNTGYNQAERVIKLSSIGDDVISVRFKFFSCQETFDKYINVAVEKFLQDEKKEKQRHLQEIAKEKASLIESRTIYSEDLSVFADEDNKQIKIYYKNMEVTKSSGLKCDFKCNNITYNIYDSNWSIEQKDKTILILHLNWEQIKLGQKWIISIKDNGICCQVWLDNERPFNFEFFRAGFLFTAEYKTFFCGCQETAFPVEFDVLEDMFLENNNSDFFGLRKQSLFPAVVLESEDEFSCFIQNNDVENSCRIFQLNIPGIIFKKGSKTFSVNIKFLEDEKMIEDYIREEKQRHLQ
ncbi:MAG: ABC transporter ATP-binding protein, partial [Candidatus Omnitrophica bacterium]|nr:ABC transporter ATP-binding protein [Candidatus Omnitrophota bacterium]